MEAESRPSTNLKFGGINDYLAHSHLQLVHLFYYSMTTLDDDWGENLPFPMSFPVARNAPSEVIYYNM